MKIVAAALLLLATPASAAVVKSAADSMVIHQDLTIDAPIQQVWDTLRAPARWWNKDHTYSDDSANLYLDPQATGCFCERLKDHGSVEHARVVYVQPPRMIRLVGSLGPLQAEAVTGTLSIRLDPEGGKATKVTLDYVVGGYVRSGADAMAPKVDEVLAQQLLGLKTAAEGPQPEDPAKRLAR